MDFCSHIISCIVVPQFMAKSKRSFAMKRLASGQRKYIDWGANLVQRGLGLNRFDPDS